MGFAKRASLTAPSDFAPAADLSTIRIVRRDKGPASIIALADNRPVDDAGKPGGDGMFYKKGSATAATFRPAYWSYEPDPSQVAGPIASLERQLDARRRSNAPSAAPIEATSEEKPLASLSMAPAIRKPAMSVDPLVAVPHQLAPTRASHAPAMLDTEAVQALLRPMPDTAMPDAAMPQEIAATAPAIEPTPSAPAPETMPPLAAPNLREEPTVLPLKLSPSAFPDTSPPSVEAPPVVERRPPAPRASVASKSPPPALPADAPAAERRPPSAAPTRKRPAREAANRTEPEGAEFDALGATIESVLASRWYGADRSGFTASPRVSRSDLAPVTPSGLIAELATVRVNPEPVPVPRRTRGGRAIAASLMVLFALAFVVALLWRTGHGSMLPTRFLPALFGTATLPQATLVLVDIDGAEGERATFF